MKKYSFLDKNGHLFGLDIGKINICGVILVTRCHLKIRGFSAPERGDFSGNSGTLQLMEMLKLPDIFEIKMKL